MPCKPIAGSNFRNFGEYIYICFGSDALVLDLTENVVRTHSALFMERSHQKLLQKVELL